MAKLGSYYGLCPSIDQKNLLGVSEDASPGCVIVTLGKNMAIKYKLSDQKQIHSWSTKEKLSSPVAYDKKGDRYVAVFNQNFIRFWNETENNLDKIKKKKFPVALHTIIPFEDEPILIFKTGYNFTLSYALEIRKDIPQLDIIDKGSSIEDQTCLKINDTIFVILLLKLKDTFKFLCTTSNNTNEQLFKSIQFQRDDFKLIGHLAANIDTGPTLFTLWSDGRLYSYPLLSLDESIKPPGNLFSVIESLSRQQQICMVSLNDNYIAMYGADSNQEGASLQIYNTQFKVTQSRHQFKLFSDGSRLWLIGTSLILTVGQNLAVVPFYLAKEQLAALVGSHKLLATADDEDLAIITEVTIGNWENNFKIVKNDHCITSELKTKIDSFLKEGWSEAAICEEIIPKLIEKQDTQTIISSLEYFIDIPENILVKLLSFCISFHFSHIKNKDVINDGLPHECSYILDKLLTTPHSDVLLMPKLRSELKFDEVLILLQYICFVLSEKGHNLAGLANVAKSEGKLIDWGCLVLDAHYQQFLLSRDLNIAEILRHFKELVDNYYLCLEDLKRVEPILSRIKRGKCGSKITKGSLKYSIEKIQLY